MTQPLSDDAMLVLGRQYLRLADREGATERDQAALRDFFPAVLHRLGEKVSVERADGADPVLDLRLGGIEMPGDDGQIELALPQPE